MPYKLIRYDREKLYREVWSEPIRKLAKKYSLSDVGLAKVCRRLRIPRPPRGYWAKKAAGKKVKVEPLPEVEDLDELVVQRWVGAGDSPDESQQSEAAAKLAYEKEPENRIIVSDNLDSPHELVRTTIEQLGRSESGDDGLLRLGQECLDLQVSRGSLDRASRILDALIKALERRAYPVSIGDREEASTSVQILGEFISFSLSEQVDRVERELTRSELREKLKYRWRFSEPEYEFIPSGRLVLMVETSWGRVLQKTWADTQKKKLEGRLNAFITGLIRISVKQRAERLERDRWQRECQEAELRRIERQQQRREEERKLNELTNQVDSWHKAERIRAYVEAVRSAAKRTHGQIEVGGELEQWLRWASEQAERIDPLVESPPSVLDD